MEEILNLVNKQIDEIDEKDVLDLIGVEEGPRLDFKEKIGQSPSDDWEFLRDVCSFVNASGGYIILGAFEDKQSGKCLGFKNVEDVEVVRQRLRQLCLDSIQDRILDFQTKAVKLKTGENIVLIFIPDSYQKPHMVSKDQKTEFWKRYEKDKRRMTMVEIREAFNGQTSLTKLENIEEKIELILRSEKEKKRTLEDEIKAKNVTRLGEIEDKFILWKAMDEIFNKAINGKRFFRLSITPDKLQKNNFNLSDQELMRFLEKPKGQRRAGWNIEPIPPVRNTAIGLESEETDFHHVLLLSSGHFEFWTEINRMFCWGQQNDTEREKRPRLSPNAVIEYPVSFLRGTKWLYQNWGIKCAYTWKMEYINVQDAILLPHQPESIAYLMSRDRAKGQSEQHLKYEADIDENYDPDVEAFNLIEKFYFSFGYNDQHIPFFDNTHHFNMSV